MTIGEIMDYHKAVGYAEGREEGRVDGIYAAFRAMNMSDEEIVQKLMDMCGLSHNEAIALLNSKNEGAPA